MYSVDAIDLVLESIGPEYVLCVILLNMRPRDGGIGFLVDFIIRCYDSCRNGYERANPGFCIILSTGGSSALDGHFCC